MDLGDPELFGAHISPYQSVLHFTESPCLLYTRNFYFIIKIMYTLMDIRIFARALSGLNPEMLQSCKVVRCVIRSTGSDFVLVLF